MQETDVIAGLAALAQETRLRLFRLLIETGTEGMTPTSITEKLGLAPSAISFHLKELLHANLVTVERQGRHLIYRADLNTMNQLLAYLTTNCCQGCHVLIYLRPAVKVLVNLTNTKREKMGLFERFLTLWVALGIAAGVALGSLFPTAFQMVAGWEYAQVNLVVAVFIWVMIYPMMIQIDWSAVKRSAANHKACS